VWLKQISRKSDLSADKPQMSADEVIIEHLHFLGRGICLSHSIFASLLAEFFFSIKNIESSIAFRKRRAIGE
jgi:hypothetical protein